MKKKYVLDACALIALLRNEDGAAVVADVINEANKDEIFLSIHKANLLEVYYDMCRVIGTEKADEVIDKIKCRPIQIIAEISDAIFIEAGRLKTMYKVSFADVFALATASVTGATLLTSDHHEIDIVEQSEPGIKFIWIR